MANPRQRNALEMFFTTKHPGENKKWAGTPRFDGESLHIGHTATRYDSPDDWVEVTVYALGNGPGDGVRSLPTCITISGAWRRFRYC